MNKLKNKKCYVSGRNGFIGSALVKRLKEEGAIVYPYPKKDLDYFFHFGSPSSNILFDSAPDYCWNATVEGFFNALKFCAFNQIKLIYPSSATVYNLNSSYSKCKAELENIQGLFEYKNVLALRIFAGYGEGEGHKENYASIIYQFCKQMINGEQPIVFGDGEQNRDFIYIDDIINTIILNLNKTGFIDIGTGVNTTFNEVINIINLGLDTDIKPIYVNKPEVYVEETICKNPVPYKHSVHDGIWKMLLLI